VLLFIIGDIIAAQFISPIQPNIKVAPEHVSASPLFTLPVIGDFYLSNTIVAILIVDVLMIIIALIVRSATRSGDLVPKGFSGAIEALLEILSNLTDSTAGKWGKTIFPWFATITLMVLLANWLELIPGVDSIGLLEKSAKGNPVVQILPGIMATIKGTAAAGEGYEVVPFVRATATDLNFTAALALISVIMTQVIGVKALGPKYFLKFFDVTAIFSKPLMGFMDFLVSLLELISELSKILSFAFRLFGNVFAGSVLIFLLSTMVPIFAPSMIFMFELFIGAIQAIVFGMLTMIFMSMATQFKSAAELEA
jgi:F-type H+-transporting ATPase subunit a